MTRRLVTPAARALLRAHDVRLDRSPGLPTVRLADARALVAPTGHGWAAVDVPVPSGQDAMDRLARVTAGAVSATRAHRVAVRTGANTVVLADAGLLSPDGIRRRLTEPVPGRVDDVDLEIVDGSEVTRLLPAPGRRPVVTIGAPARRVVPAVHDGDEVIAVRTVVEIWAHGGESADSARLAHSAARAVVERNQP